MKLTLLANMACPFIEDPINEEAALLHRELHICPEIILRLQLDVLSFPDDSYLLERYRFSWQSITYLHNLIRPHITNIAHRGCALASELSSFLYNIGDVETY